MKNSSIVSDIVQHTGTNNTSSWYVGIATDARNRLFNDHNVSEKEGSWIYRNANSERDARDTEKHLLDNYNYKGGTGGGDKPTYVYAYKITNTTVE